MSAGQGRDGSAIAGPSPRVCPGDRLAAREDTANARLHHRDVHHRLVVIVVFEGVQGIDAFGPADVFYFANYVAQQSGEDRPPYTVSFAAAQAGPIGTASGPRIHADHAVSDPDLRPDLLLVAGGLAVQDAASDERLVADLGSLAARSEEVGSVCTGALLLAEAGLLDGRQATTHWALAEMLIKAHPEVEVDADRIYLHDGVWSSAGVTAGIDLALQIVQTHHGAEMAAQAARFLVVYLQRAGGQQQFSAHLAARQSPHPTIADLMAHIADHPDADLSIEALADHVAMSERSFQRLFSRETGMSPGRYVERTRVDAARRLLEQTEDGIAAIAGQCGFASVETFHRAFRRLVGVTPAEYRRRFTYPRAMPDHSKNA